MATIKPFDAGGWFPIHNHVFDVIMPSLSPNGCKVLCVAIRQTWGWRAEGDPSGLEGHGHREREQEDHQGHRRRHTDAMPPNELPRAVRRARGTRQHRLVLKVPPEVRGQLGRRAVSPRTVLLQGLHDDPVEIAP